jgi:hypothetical protein
LLKDMRNLLVFLGSGKTRRDTTRGTTSGQGSQPAA